MDSLVIKKIEGFFSQYPLRQYKKGQILIYAGDDPPGILHLEKGQVRVYDTTTGGNEIVVNVFKSPTFFPMSWAINKTLNEYNFVAESDISVRVAPAPKALAFIKSNPDVAFDLLERLYTGTDGIIRRMVQAMKGSARSRTILELIISSKRFGIKQRDSYIISTVEVELAARTGLARETINRELNKLEREGLISSSYKTIRVMNLGRLEKELKRG